MISRLFAEGQQKLKDAHAAREKEKVGILRAGNTGLLTEDMTILGKCMAQTWLRFKGISTENLETKHGTELMFEGGRANETLWKEVLEQSWDGIILCEEEIPISWRTTSGTLVTGRPDMVLCDKDRKPVIGIELKQVASFWTAYDIKVKRLPKYDHILQAAHYAWQLGIPYQLWYTSRTDFHINEAFIKNRLPAYGTVDYIEYSYGKKSSAKSGMTKISKQEWDALPEKDRVESPLKIRPFTQGYDIKLEKGLVWYKAVEDKLWTRTDIKVANIQSYYEMIPELEEVPPEPRVVKLDGKPAGYRASDYCVLSAKGLCCKQRQGQLINDWAKDILKLTDENK